ncbi:MAG: polysaccharide deacetylase family protein, partial [Bacteroidota bacterium]
MFFKFPDILKKFYPDAIWTLPSEFENVKDVYLTFDDGPTEGVTDWVLDLLMKHGVKATFFCLGKNIESNPDLLHRISAEGHTAANHTFNHLNGWKNSTQKYLKPHVPELWYKTPNINHVQSLINYASRITTGHVPVITPF